MEICFRKILTFRIVVSKSVEIYKKNLGFRQILGQQMRKARILLKQFLFEISF